jgi:Rieske Fe-S protein
MTNKNNSDNRREFLKKAGVLLGAGITVTSLSSLIVSCEKDELLPAPPVGSSATINLADYPSLLSVGGFAICTIKTPQELSYMVKRESSTEFLIFQTLCPHQGEPLLLPDKAGANIFCPRHNVEFSPLKDSKGNVVKNPQGVSVGALKSNYTYEYDSAKNILKILL